MPTSLLIWLGNWIFHKSELPVINIQYCYSTVDLLKTVASLYYFSTYFYLVSNVRDAYLPLYPSNFYDHVNEYMNTLVMCNRMLFMFVLNPCSQRGYPLSFKKMMLFFFLVATTNSRRWWAIRWICYQFQRLISVSIDTLTKNLHWPVQVS